MVLIILGAGLVVELLALGWLYLSVQRYHNYWLEQAKQPGQLTYVALGDSAAQGIGASSPRRGYVGLIAARLEAQTGKTVRVVNLSKTGAKLQDYLNEQAPKLKGLTPDLVTIEIGANDVDKFNAKTYRGQFREVLGTLPPRTYVSNMPLFNSRPTSTPKAKQASVIIQEELQRYPDLYFVDLQKQTSQHQSIFNFAPDLFHPNNPSYKNWAEAFWLKIQDTH